MPQRIVRASLGHDRGQVACRTVRIVDRRVGTMPPAQAVVSAPSWGWAPRLTSAMSRARIWRIRSSRALLGRGTGLLEDDDALAKDHQRGNGADAEVAGQLVFLVGVDLGEGDVGVFAGRGLEDRGEATAGAAPRRPEVEDDDVVAADGGIEVSGLEFLDGHVGGTCVMKGGGRPEGGEVLRAGEAGRRPWLPSSGSLMPTDCRRWQRWGQPLAIGTA